LHINIDDLGMYFEKGKPVLDRLNLSFEPGRFTGLLGPSGCGKTTLLRILAGLERPTSGRVRFNDQTMVDMATGIFIEPEKRNVGMVFQNYAVWPHMTVFENAAFPLRMQKRPKSEIAERVHAVLTQVHMEELSHRRPDALSGGQQQRVALARALVQQPRVLLLDEPLSNLDANLRAEMRTLIRALQQEHGLTAIIVTHDWADAKALSDTVVVLRQGQIEQMGPPEELVENPNSDFVVSLTQ